MKEKKDPAEIRWAKQIANAINWQNKRIYEIEKLVKYLVNQELGLEDGDNPDDDGENTDNYHIQTISMDSQAVWEVFNQKPTCDNSQEVPEQS